MFHVERRVGQRPAASSATGRDMPCDPRMCWGSTVRRVRWSFWAWRRSGWSFNPGQTKRVREIGRDEVPGPVTDEAADSFPPSATTATIAEVVSWRGSMTRVAGEGISGRPLPTPTSTGGRFRNRRFSGEFRSDAEPESGVRDRIEARVACLVFHVERRPGAGGPQAPTRTDTARRGLSGVP